MKKLRKIDNLLWQFRKYCWNVLRFNRTIFLTCFRTFFWTIRVCSRRRISRFETKSIFGINFSPLNSARPIKRFRSLLNFWNKLYSTEQWLPNKNVLAIEQCLAHKTFLVTVENLFSNFTRKILKNELLRLKSLLEQIKHLSAKLGAYYLVVIACTRLMFLLEQVAFKYWTNFTEKMAVDIKINFLHYNYQEKSKRQRKTEPTCLSFRYIGKAKKEKNKTKEERQKKKNGRKAKRVRKEKKRKTTNIKWK